MNRLNKDENCFIDYKYYKLIINFFSILLVFKLSHVNKHNIPYNVNNI